MTSKPPSKVSGRGIEDLARTAALETAKRYRDKAVLLRQQANREAVKLERDARKLEEMVEANPE